MLATVFLTSSVQKVSALLLRTLQSVTSFNLDGRHHLASSASLHHTLSSPAVHFELDVSIRKSLKSRTGLLQQNGTKTLP
jgi:hypothetical protein